MGAVINMRPDLWKGVVAGVPFVDVVTTMLDESIPLTTGEFDEWGNPKNKEYYDYIKSYSPYDNIGAKEYPAKTEPNVEWEFLSGTEIPPREYDDYCSIVTKKQGENCVPRSQAPMSQLLNVCQLARRTKLRAS